MYSITAHGITYPSRADALAAVAKLDALNTDLGASDGRVTERAAILAAIARGYAAQAAAHIIGLNAGRDDAMRGIPSRPDFTGDDPAIYSSDFFTEAMGYDWPADISSAEGDALDILEPAYTHGYYIGRAITEGGFDTRSNALAVAYQFGHDARVKWGVSTKELPDPFEIVAAVRDHTQNPDNDPPMVPQILTEWHRGYMSVRNAEPS